jgi:hypothetical protein
MIWPNDGWVHFVSMPQSIAAWPACKLTSTPPGRRVASLGWRSGGGLALQQVNSHGCGDDAQNRPEAGANKDWSYFLVASHVGVVPCAGKGEKEQGKENGDSS